MREKEQLISNLSLQMTQKEKLITNQLSVIAERDNSIRRLEEEILNLKQTLTSFKIQGVLSSATAKDSFNNKFSLMLSEEKVSSKLVEFLIPREMLELSLTSKLVNSQVRHYSGLFACVAKNSMWDKENIQYATLKGKSPHQITNNHLEHVSQLRLTIEKNKPTIQLFLSRYLYYDYDITPLVQQTIKQSLENIENVKENYHSNEPAKERSRGLSSVFKSILSIPEKKKESLKLSDIKGVDL